MIKSKLMLKMSNGETIFHIGKFYDWVETAEQYLFSIQEIPRLSIGKSKAISTQFIVSLEVVERNLQ